MNEFKPANAPHYVFEVPSVSNSFRVIQFWGDEGISSLFHYSIQLESDSTDVVQEDVVGQKATLVINSQSYERSISGIISRFEFSGMEREVAVYNIDLVPEVFQLSQQQDCRIFQNLAVDKILEKVMQSAGINSNAYKFSLNDSYDPLVYCTQYRESDLDFLNRLAERFGIFYFFKFSKDNTILMLGDSPNVHPKAEPEEEIFYREGGPTELNDYIDEFKFARRMRSTKRTLRDYNFTKPRVDLTKQHKSDSKLDYEWYDYPGKYETEDEGKKIAQIRQQAEVCAEFDCEAAGNSVRLYPGAKFKLVNHPIDEYNKEYLVTEVKQTGSQPTIDNVQFGDFSFSSLVRFQPFDIPFRPLCSTRKPVVEGSQTARVSGPEGHEIFTDKYGRVKVRFHWDRESTPDDQSSCWIRVSQAWAGKGWGAVYIPRIGHEVIVDFLEGDPDKPVITGSVYNGMNMPPYQLPDQQTVSTIKSNSSLDGTGYNEIRFEDQKDSEEFYIQAEKDMLILTKSNKDQTTGGSETLQVKKDRTKNVDENEQSTIGGNRTENVGKDETIKIGANRSESVGKDETIKIDANRSESVGKKEDIKIGENRSINIGKNETREIGQNEAISIKKNLTETIGENYSTDISKNMKFNVGKEFGCYVNDNILINSDKNITLKCGKSSLVLDKSGKIEIKGSDIKIKGSGTVAIKGSKVTEN
jgi:type VI secretion system secreted protein VgrG